MRIFRYVMAASLWFGSSAAGQILTYSPTSLTFPPTPANGAATEQFVKITNNGSTPAIFSDYLLPLHFSLDPTPPTSVGPLCGQQTDAAPNLQPRASCTVFIIYNPSAASTSKFPPAACTPGSACNFSIDLENDPQATLYSVPLIATTGTGPVLKFSPALLTFPATPAGGSSTAQVAVTNTGNSTATISQFPSGSVFSEGANTCYPAIAAGATCNIIFSFSPPATATIGSVLTADVLNSPPNPLGVVLSGGVTFPLNASGAVMAPLPLITLNPAQITISAAVGAADTQGPSIKVTNPGAVPVTITNLATSNTSYALLENGGACQTLAPAATCSFDVYFRPPAKAGTYQATITVSYTANGASGQATAQFTGIAIPTAPAVSIDHTTLTLKAPVGQTSPIQTAIVTNTGTANLLVSSVTFSGSQQGFIKVTDTCAGQTISPGNTCRLDFNYNPAVAGPSQTTVTLTDNATPSTQTITLTGGISGPAVLISPDGASVPFNVILGTPQTVTFKLTNAGDTVLKVQNIQLRDNENGFALGDLTSCFTTPLNPGPPGQYGDSCSFPVTFNPPNADNGGLYSNALIVNINPGLSSTVTLSGIALLPPPPSSLPPAGTVSPGSADAAVEPVDGGTGQYYAEELDFDLGGPMNLQLGRYYGSALSAGGFKSAMGMNWMNNFDVSMALKGTSAQVMLFRGKIVNFTQSGGVWSQTSSPPGAVYQFAQTGSGYQLLSPVSNLVYAFNAAGKLTGVMNRRGNSLTITPGPNGPTSISDGLGRTLTLTYTSGQLTQVQDQTGRTVTYSYSGGNLVSAANANQETTQYAYTSSGSTAGLMTQKVYPLGNAPTTQTYAANGKVTAQTDPAGNTLYIAYDGKGGTTITGPLGETTVQANNGNADLANLADPAGNETSVTFDGAGRRAAITDRGGNSSRFTYYEPTGNLASRTNEMGGTTSYNYTPQTYLGFTLHNTTGITYPDSAQESFAYDANGNVISHTLPDGTVSTFGFDSNNNLTSATDANQQTTTFTYNPDGSMASKQDALGNIWAFSYSPAGKPSKVADPNGGTALMTFDPVNRPLTLTDATGAVTALQYDANGERSSLINPGGGAFKYSYNAQGLLTALTDPLGNSTIFTYDAEGRRASITDAAGEQVTRTYDLVGRITRKADNNGPRMTFAWDAESHLTSQTDPTGRTFAYAYNPRGQITSTTKPDGTRYAFTYDQRDRLLSMTNPLGETQSVVRDAVGRITQVTLPGGLSSSIQRDALGRVMAITGPNGNTWSMLRDALGRMTTYTDPLGNATAYSYTGTFMTGMTFPLGTVAITRDLKGRVTLKQYSDGTIQHRTWDPMGLLLSADGVAIQRDVMGHPVNVNGLAITYTPAGRLAGITYSPGKTVTYSYDPAGRLASMNDWVGGQTLFSYDAASRMTGVTYPNGVTASYSFDANGRLSGISEGGLASIGLTRDADGKITAADRNLPALPALQSASQQFSYNAGSQLAGESYDAMGRALTQNNRAYTWNLASQLTGFQDDSNTGSLTYDGLGELASNTIDGVTKNYVFNPVLRYPALSTVQQGGADVRYYVYLPNGSVLYSVEAADNTRHFFHFDEMGNTAFLTGDDGSVTDTYAVTPYGDVADHVGTADNPFTWQGQYGIIEEAPGLYFMRKRHYDASAARFLSVDPVTTPDPRSAEPYIYARGNPLFFTDPSGALTWAEISSFQSSVGGLDNEVPTQTEVTNLLFKNIDPGTWDVTPLAIAFETLLVAHPGLTWSQLHYLADDAPSPSKPLPPTNVDGLAHCVATKSCDPAFVAGLTFLVNEGLGSQLEQSVTQTLSLASSLIGQDGSGLIGQDGSGLIGQDGSGLIGQDGSGLIGQDGSGLIGQDGSGLIGQDGSGLIGQDGSGLTNNSVSSNLGS